MTEVEKEIDHLLAGAAYSGGKIMAKNGVEKCSPQLICLLPQETSILYCPISDL